MAISELDKISPKALMQRITDELEGLIIADAEGRYIYVNHRWSSLTGYTLDQVKGRFVRDIVVNSLVDEVLKSQKFISGNAVLLNVRTGAEVPVYCSYTPLFHNGEIEGCFVYMIPKSEHTSMAIPPNVTTLLEALNKQLLMMQPRSAAAASSLDSIIGASPEITKIKHEVPLRLHGAHRGGNRQRQGAGGPRHPRAQPPSKSPAGQGQLRRNSLGAAGIGVFRLCGRGLYRGPPGRAGRKI